MNKKIDTILCSPEDKVALIIISRNNEGAQQVLFTLEPKKRHHYDPHKGLYLKLPGGKIDPGETILDTAKREVFEELGIAVKLEDLRYLLSLASKRRGHKCLRRLHLVRYDLDQKEKLQIHSESTNSRVAKINNQKVMIDEIHDLRRMTRKEIKHLKKNFSTSKHVTKPVLDVVPYLLKEVIPPIRPRE